MNTFWRQGFCATSIDDLSRATGLQRGSLSNAFGSKSDIFLLALKRYNADFEAALGEDFDGLPPAQAIARFIDVCAARFTDPAHPPGCLATLACAELPELSEAAQAEVRRSVDAIAEILTSVFTQAIKEGLVDGSVAAEDHAAHLAMLTRGMAVLFVATGDRARVDGAARSAKSAFGIQ